MRATPTLITLRRPGATGRSPRKHARVWRPKNHYAAGRQAGQGAASRLCTGHVDALFAGSKRACLLASAALSRHHAIIRLDVMRTRFEDAATAILLGMRWRQAARPSCPVDGRPAQEGAVQGSRPAKSKPAAKPKAKAAGEEPRGASQGGCRQARGRHCAQPAALVAAAGRGGPARRPLRCGHRAGARPRRLRRGRHAPARGDRGSGRQPASQDAKALRDKVTDPAARKLVDWYLLPWRLWHGRRDSRLPRCQSRPGPTAAC